MIMRSFACAGCQQRATAAARLGARWPDAVAVPARSAWRPEPLQLGARIVRPTVIADRAATDAVRVRRAVGLVLLRQGFTLWLSTGGKQISTELGALAADTLLRVGRMNKVT